MKRLALMALASGLAIAAASPANAAVFFAYQLQPGGAINAVAATALGGGLYQGGSAAGGFTFTFNASGLPALTSPGLSSQTITVQADGAKTNALTLYVGQTDNAAFTGNISSSFTSQGLTGGASSVTLSTYYNAAGGVVYTGTSLGSATFNGLGTQTAGSGPLALAAGFSTLQRYDLTFTGAGTFNDTIQISGVPEPTTWGMMILGFGLMGGALRTRKTKVAFA